jgi:hypothetical protein
MRQKCGSPDLWNLRERGTLRPVGVELRCVDCGAESVSSLFWRGPGQHGCGECGGQLVLASDQDERRAGADRRRKRFLKRWPDWRAGADRRANSVRDSAATRAAI